MTEQAAEPPLAKRGASIPFSKEALEAEAINIFSGITGTAINPIFDMEALERAIVKVQAAYPGGEQKAERSTVSTTITIHETFESPTWKRPGTESYFREAQAAGYYGVDEATGEAYRVVDPADQRLKPKREATPERGSLTWEDVKHEEAVLGPVRVLVRANLPHIDEMSDGALGPVVDLAYEWGRDDEMVWPGRVVWCPATPSGPQVPFPAVVVTVDPNNIDYSGPVKQVVGPYRQVHTKEYESTVALLNSPASKPRKD